jgi:hypothetical protein
MAGTTRIQFWRNRRGRWHWHKKSANGQVVAGPQQGFASSQGCRRSAKREEPGLELERIDAPAR